MRKLILVLMLCLMAGFVGWRYREVYNHYNLDERYYQIDCWKFNLKIPFLKPPIDEWEENGIIYRGVPLNDSREIILM